MVQLRKANSSDDTAILDVHRAAIRAINPDRYTGDEVDAWAAAQDDPSQYPLDDQTQYLAVAETEDNRLVGFVGLDLPDGVLETLYVHPDVQGEGIGATLLAHAEKRLRDYGHDVCIMAASRNAVPFYRRHGYSGEDETFTLKMGETPLEFVRMEKVLS